jgi:hypothetical protein
MAYILNKGMKQHKYTIFPFWVPGTESVPLGQDQGIASQGYLQKLCGVCLFCASLSWRLQLSLTIVILVQSPSLCFHCVLL